MKEPPLKSFSILNTLGQKEKIKDQDQVQEGKTQDASSGCLHRDPARALVTMQGSSKCPEEKDQTEEIDLTKQGYSDSDEEENTRNACAEYVSAFEVGLYQDDLDHSLVQGTGHCILKN